MDKNLQSGAELQLNEAIIEQNLDSADKQIKIGEALTAIRQGKLYRSAGCTSFETYVQGRWKRSRAWAYQLIKFVEVKQACAALKAPAPANERQARERWLEPKAKLQPLKELDYWHRSQRLFRYLTRKFEAWPAEEKAKFANDLLTLVQSCLAKTKVLHPQS